MAAKRLGLSELKSLQEALKRRAEEQAEQAKRARIAEQSRRREASEFQEAMQDVEPLKGSGRKHLVATPPAPVAEQRRRDERAALSQSLSDEFDAESLLETDEKLSWRRDGIGADVVRKLRRGHWVIAAELDLHGLRRDEARDELGQFLKDCLRRGQRCVRIIHGKGLGSVAQQPVLKAKVFNWLTQKDEVLAMCQARAHDGGSGALVVLLRAQS